MLGLQLYHLGFTDNPTMPKSSTLALDLQNMYEHVGDCISIQYGGSQVLTSFIYTILLLLFILASLLNLKRKKNLK